MQENFEHPKSTEKKKERKKKNKRSLFPKKNTHTHNKLFCNFSLNFENHWKIGKQKSLRKKQRRIKVKKFKQKKGIILTKGELKALPASEALSVLGVAGGRGEVSIVSGVQ